MKGFSIISQQVNLFPKVNVLNNVGRTVSELLRLKIFNGAPTVLPLGADAPPGVTVVTLRSADGLISCEISSDKIALTWANEDPMRPTELKTILSNTKEVVSAVFGKEQHYKRIGFVTTVGKITDSPQSAASLILADDGRVQVPSESLVRFFANVTYEERLAIHEKCFRVMTIGPANKLLPPNENLAVIVQDVSNQPDESCDFDLVFVNTFIEQAEAISSINKIVEWVWP